MGCKNPGQCRWVTEHHQAVNTLRVRLNFGLQIQLSVTQVLTQLPGIKATEFARRP